MSKEKVSKIELLTKGKNNKKLRYNYRKGVITASKASSDLTKMDKIFQSTGGCVDMWSLCQNMSGLSFTNPDLPALKYGRTMEMEAANKFFELMKKKQKFCYFRVWFIFGQNKLFFWSKSWSPNDMWLLWRCMCWNKMPFVNKLWKTIWEKPGLFIKKWQWNKTENQSILFYSMYTWNGSNQQKIVLLCCMDTPW